VTTLERVAHKRWLILLTIIVVSLLWLPVWLIDRAAPWQFGL
jgi:hypothetical protein